jgi:hypothetical protein
MVALEVESEGEDGILFKRFGPAQLWGHWDLDKQWEPRAMPLTLRFLIEKGMETIWQEIAVTLSCPEGWAAEGRQPQHWTRPAALQRETLLIVSPVPAQRRIIAPFWVQWPDGLELELGWHEGPAVPFHTTTQPGPGLTLYAKGVTAPVEITFRVALRITTTTGEVLRRELTTPVMILPVARP